MRRKPIHKLLKSITRLRSVIRASRDRLVCHLADRSAGTSYGPIIDHLYAELTAVAPDLADAEDAYGVAQARLAESREKRNHAASRLAARHAPIVRLLRGQTQLRGVSVVVSTPQSPTALARQAHRMARFLRRFEGDPAPLDCGIKIDAGDLAEDLKTGVRRLKASIAEVSEAEAAVGMAREQANRAFAGADWVVTWVGRLYESLGGLAGEEEVVGRIRRCLG